MRQVALISSFAVAAICAAMLGVVALRGLMLKRPHLPEDVRYRQFRRTALLLIVGTLAAALNYAVSHYWSTAPPDPRPPIPVDTLAVGGLASGQFAVPQSLSILLIALGIVSIPAGVGVAKTEGFGKVAGPLISAGGLTLLALGGVTLVKLQIDDVTLFKAVAGGAPVLREIGRIGPFEEADTLLEFPEGVERLNDILANLDSLTAGEAASFIIIVGGTDRRPLRPNSAARFGSNLGLGQARAAAIRNVIVGRGDTNLPIVTLPGGGSWFDPRPERNAFASDRSVVVYVGSTLPRRRSE